MLRHRRKLDKEIQGSGGFKAATTPQAAAKISTERLVSDIMRHELGDQFPELAAANKEFSLYQKASDIIDRRELGQVGTADPWMANVGRISDDLVASYLGHAVGGTPGMIAAEGLNLLRQTRGLRSGMASRQGGRAAAIRRILQEPRAQ